MYNINWLSYLIVELGVFALSASVALTCVIGWFSGWCLNIVTSPACTKTGVYLFRITFTCNHWPWDKFTLYQHIIHLILFLNWLIEEPSHRNREINQPTLLYAMHNGDKIKFCQVVHKTNRHAKHHTTCCVLNSWKKWQFSQVENGNYLHLTQMGLFLLTELAFQCNS